MGIDCIIIVIENYGQLGEWVLMVDIHCHILNGLDDGPQSLEQSMELSRELHKKGIEKIIATPHYISGDDYVPTCDEITEKARILQQEIDKEGMKLKIYTGMEVYASHDTIEKIKNNEILSLNDSRYILIEFPFEVIPRYISDLLFAMQLEGFTPIIAHPERYCSKYRKSKLLKDLVDKGVLLQINSESLTGAYGKRAKKAAYQLLKKRMVHFVASDSHSLNRIMSNKQEIERKISRICGYENAQRIMYINPQRVLENENVLHMCTLKKRLLVRGILRKLRLNM